MRPDPRRRPWRAVFAVALLGATLVGAGAHRSEAATVPRTPAPGDRLVVSVTSTTADVLAALDTVAAANGGRLLRSDDVLKFAVVTAPPAAQAAVAAALQATPGVAGVRHDVEVRALYKPDDTWYFDQWGPHAMGLPAAWEGGTGTQGRVVGVIDSGIDYTHPDLEPNYCFDGPDYTAPWWDPWRRPYDQYGHGTLVAGTLAAKINNGRDIAGVTDACLVSIKVLDASGIGYSTDLASALVWAADHGIHVVNMSLGSHGPGGEGSAVNYALSKGVVLVAGAGNDGCGSSVLYPAAYPGVIAVGALDDPTTRSSFSTCGPEVDLAAPGAQIRSTSMGGGMQVVRGTSIATPQVAGVAALLWDRASSLTSGQIRCVLEDTADDIGPVGVDVQFGHGRVDADGGAERLAQPSLPAWPNCAGNSDTTPPRRVSNIYLTPNDGPSVCSVNLVVQCVALQPGEVTVDLHVDDLALTPAPGAYSFHNASGTTLASGTFCGSRNEIPIPTGATQLRTRAAGAVGGVLDCGGPNVASWGSMIATFDD